MKGLLLKDLSLLKNMKTYAFLILVISLFMLFNGQDVSFITSYTTMVFVIMGTNTLHYDAFNNGYAFLFTLPVTRKVYVLEKYVFSLLTVLAGISFSTVIMVIASFMGDATVLSGDSMSYVLGIGAGGMILLGVLLPIELKFGPEKSRIALIIVVAVVAAVAYLLAGGPFDFSGIIETLSKLKPIVFVASFVAIAFVFTVISYAVSCRIVEKKEF